MAKKSFKSLGVFYTEEEETMASMIRVMPEGDEKKYRIRCFMIGTGKNFPHRNPIGIGFTNTAHMSSIEIERGCARIAEDMRGARKRLSL